MTDSELVNRFRRAEYTGENRCIPCTVANGGIAAVAAVVVALFAAPWLGVLSFVAAALVIYLRGYLVPGTPALTRRYFPPWLLRLFGKEPVAAVPTASGDAGRPLVAAGVLRATDEGPVLTPRFGETWSERAAARHATGANEADVAAAFDAESVSRLGDASFVLDGDTSVRWESTAALAADVAGAELLAERVGWTEYDRDRRRTTLQALRLRLDSCPACGATLVAETRRVDPCCQRPHLVAESVCEGCGAVVADAAVVDTGGLDSVAGALLGWETRETEIEA
ncbi:hypothetical protein SAMN04487948_10786 [Halogranum amylolyticum]|uniref:Uncharacterized protein n=1 Tax=Halogranum amylolyticum TaxID=660520 RepID=A0A1H8TIZ2_9EURY|nr:hypothetical protein [Halogranum amylolyticum]SEO90771.1 hypothetical protein SAMN04487948_10786 [Halogranum amylolyticum]